MRRVLRASQRDYDATDFARLRHDFAMLTVHSLAYAKKALETAMTTYGHHSADALAMSLRQRQRGEALIYENASRAKVFYLYTGHGPRDE